MYRCVDFFDKRTSLNLTENEEGFRLEAYAIPGIAFLSNKVDYAYFAARDGNTSVPTSLTGAAFSTGASRPTRFARTIDFLQNFFEGRTLDAQNLPRVVATTLFNLLRTTAAYDMLLRGREFGRESKDLFGETVVTTSSVALLDICQELDGSDSATPRYESASPFANERARHRLYGIPRRL